MSAKFQVGDVVRLKSGGLNMTVAGLSGEWHVGRIQCEWFCKDQHKEDYFNEAVLEKVPPSTSQMAPTAAVCR